MAVVFAQLITPDEKNHGVHGFVIQIRDKLDHKVLQGVVIGDCGQKLGLHGMDNGFMQFNHYRVPKDALLDRFG